MPVNELDELAVPLSGHKRGWSRRHLHAVTGIPHRGKSATLGRTINSVVASRYLPRDAS
jgi:hypothetical protein